MSDLMQIAGDVPRARLRTALFEEDFDLPPSFATPEPEIIAPDLQNAALASARADAWAEGYVAGRAEAEAEVGRAAAAMVETLARELIEARRDLTAQCEASAQAIAQLFLDALASVFPLLCERHGPAEARAVARVLLPGLSQEAEIVLRASPTLVADMEEEVLRTIPEDERARVRIVPDATLRPGDLRVRWRAGTAVRDGTALWQAVVAALAPNGLLSAEVNEVCHAG